jgi:hypothetical protein
VRSAVIDGFGTQTHSLPGFTSSVKRSQHSSHNQKGSKSLTSAPARPPFITGWRKWSTTSRPCFRVRNGAEHKGFAHLETIDYSSSTITAEA